MSSPLHRSCRSCRRSRRTPRPSRAQQSSPRGGASQIQCVPSSVGSRLEWFGGDARWHSGRQASGRRAARFSNAGDERRTTSPISYVVQNLRLRTLVLYQDELRSLAEVAASRKMECTGAAPSFHASPSRRDRGRPARCERRCAGWHRHGEGYARDLHRRRSEPPSLEVEPPPYPLRRRG
jgi:hypothetical protein